MLEHVVHVAAAKHLDPGPGQLIHLVSKNWMFHILHTCTQGLPTVPSLLGEEKATNPFLRPHDAALRARLGVAAGAADWEAFGAVRKAKDEFR